MHDAVTKMLKLGKVSVEKELDFADALSELPDKLTLEEAEALLSIFEVDDDDHSAFAWMWLEFMKQVEGLNNSKVLRSSKAYWVQILAYSLERNQNNRS
jgi:hypothetical protein